MRTEAPRRVDVPEPGFFLLRLVKGGVQVAARIIHDESGWSAEINGERGPAAADPFEAPGLSKIWTFGLRVDEAEYRYRLDVAQWARAHQPTHPAADPTRPVDPLTDPTPF